MTSGKSFPTQDSVSLVLWVLESKTTVRLVPLTGLSYGVLITVAAVTLTAFVLLPGRHDVNVGVPRLGQVLLQCPEPSLPSEDLPLLQTLG